MRLARAYLGCGAGARRKRGSTPAYYVERRTFVILGRRPRMGFAPPSERPRHAVSRLVGLPSLVGSRHERRKSAEACVAGTLSQALSEIDEVIEGDKSLYTKAGHLTTARARAKRSRRRAFRQRLPSRSRMVGRSISDRADELRRLRHARDPSASSSPPTQHPFRLALFKRTPAARVTQRRARVVRGSWFRALQRSAWCWRATRTCSAIVVDQVHRRGEDRARSAIGRTRGGGGQQRSSAADARWHDRPHPRPTTRLRGLRRVRRPGGRPGRRSRRKQVQRSEQLRGALLLRAAALRPMPGRFRWWRYSASNAAGRLWRWRGAARPVTVTRIPCGRVPAAPPGRAPARRHRRCSSSSHRWAAPWRRSSSTCRRRRPAARRAVHGAAFGAGKGSRSRRDAAVSSSSHRACGLSRPTSGTSTRARRMGGGEKWIVKTWLMEAEREQGVQPKVERPLTSTRR